MQTNTQSLGDLCIYYPVCPETGRTGLEIVPASMVGQRVARREKLEEAAVANLPSHWPPFKAWSVDSLVQVALKGVPGPERFAQGLTMRNGVATESLRFKDQQRAGNSIITLLTSPLGFECEHQLSLLPGTRVLESRTLFRNTSSKPLTLTLLSSFSLGGISPFQRDAAHRKLKLHRVRSMWSAEGQLDSRLLEESQLIPSWTGHAIACERFGQVGTLPVRGWFPFAALEDIEAGCTWAAQLAWPGSWQLEAYRRDDCACLSGGLADYEFGHWAKTVAAGESFESPVAYLTSVQGGVDQAAAALQPVYLLGDTVASEQELPILCNDWCTTWGTPSHDTSVAIAERLKDTPVRYLVIDDGWADRPEGCTLHNGDWEVNRRSFANGLRATADAIRARGMIPGIWFEFEVATRHSKAFELTTHQLHRDGHPIEVGTRHFWDFRDPWVHEHLAAKVIALLREAGIGYMKVDYNDTVGIGCDGSESLGEGLRQHVEGVIRFFQRIRKELPDLVLEICSSGGHRLEPLLMSIGSMGSFSDAHETPEIPIIAADVARLIPPRKNQIWAVLRAADTPQRMVYSLAATFLGRMCLSGEIHALNPQQERLLREAMALYRKAVSVIRDGTSRRFGPVHVSRREPEGWQGVLRVDADERTALAVLHVFDAPYPDTIEIPLPSEPEGEWQISDCLCGEETPLVSMGTLSWQPSAAFSACVVLLQRDEAWHEGTVLDHANEVKEAI